MNPPESPSSHSPARFDPLVVGTLLSAASALGYTAANICLRDVAETCHPAWVSCIKAVPTAAVAWLLIAGRAVRGLPALPTTRLLPVLVLTALGMQLGGNVCSQWSLGVIGLALTIPLLFGALVLGGALAGRIWLGEGISPRSALAMLLLILAVAILSWGAKRHAAPADRGQAIAKAAAQPTLSEADATPHYGRLIAAGAVAAACFSGFCYAASNVVIRRVAGNLLPLSATLMVMSTTGVVSLGLLSVWQIGWSGMWQTSGEAWRSMVLAGLFNAAAFFALGQALQAISVTRSNIINASQVALSALAGVVLFGEPLTVALCIGLALTLLGLITMQRRE